MATERLQMSVDEFRERVRSAPGRSLDDVSITLNGQRLDTKAAVLAWWNDVASAIEAEQAERVRVDGDRTD